MGSYIYFISVSKELLVPASALSCVSCVHFSWLCTFHAHVYACKYFFNPFFQKWHRGALTQPHIFSFWWRPGRKSSLTEWWSWTALSSLAGRHSNRPRGWTMPFLRVVGIDIWCNIFFWPFFVFSLLLPFSMLKNAFKKYPPQNRTNFQKKGGGVKGLLNNVQKNCTFLKRWHP